MMVPQHVTLIPVFIIIRGLGLYNNLGALIVPLCRQRLWHLPA